MFSVVLGNVKATVFNRWMREMWQKFKGILPASSHDMLQILRACCNIQSRKNKMEKSNHKEAHGGGKLCQRMGRRRRRNESRELKKKKKEEEESGRMYQCLRAAGGITGGALKGWTTDLLACART